MQLMLQNLFDDNLKAFYEELLISSNIPMVVVEYFFAESHQFDISFLTTLVSLNWFFCTNINHVIGMLNDFHAKYGHTSMKIFI